MPAMTSLPRRKLKNRGGDRSASGCANLQLQIEGEANDQGGQPYSDLQFRVLSSENIIARLLKPGDE